MKGIWLKGTEEEKLTMINDYIGELGGSKVRKRRNSFSGDLEIYFSGKRAGECCPTSEKDVEAWDNQPCFGFRLEEVKSTSVYRPFHDRERGRVHMKAKKWYSLVTHYTLLDCRRDCLFSSLVVCVRTLSTTDEEYMTTHIAGKCPYCTYFFRY
jgi:hypothetical protein